MMSHWEAARLREMRPMARSCTGAPMLTLQVGGKPDGRASLPPPRAASAAADDASAEGCDDSAAARVLYLYETTQCVLVVVTRLSVLGT